MFFIPREDKHRFRSHLRSCAKPDRANFGLAASRQSSKAAAEGVYKYNTFSLQSRVPFFGKRIDYTALSAKPRSWTMHRLCSLRGTHPENSRLLRKSSDRLVHPPRESAAIFGSKTVSSESSLTLAGGSQAPSRLLHHRRRSEAHVRSQHVAHHIHFRT